MNKFIKFIGYIFVHLLVAIEVYILALALVSPVMNIAMGVMDSIHKTPVYLEGKYFIIWLLLAVVLWIPMYVYTEVKGHIGRHPKPEKETEEKK
jgi:hypothetical protein